jgi:hypothetical protein
LCLNAGDKNARAAGTPASKAEKNPPIAVAHLRNARRLARMTSTDCTAMSQTSLEH